MSDAPAADGVLLGASLALGPIPEVGFLLRFIAIFGALGALAAAKSFQRTGDADPPMAHHDPLGDTLGLGLGVVAVVSHVLVGVP